MDWIADPSSWIALITLTSLEIVLGIDNIVFISILTGRLPAHRQNSVRMAGLAVAMLSRILLVFSLSWVMKLTAPLFAIAGHSVSGKDLLLIVGGLFLLAKSTLEIHHSFDTPHEEHAAPKTVTVHSILIQIAVIDVVFSLDSVITAVGMVQHITIMVAAIIVSVGIMMLAAGPISRFIESQPTLKMLALSFLILIGMTLVGEGMHFHVPKGYLYFAMAFSTLVEMLNIRLRSKHANRSLMLREVKRPVS